MRNQSSCLDTGVKANGRVKVVWVVILVDAPEVHEERVGATRLRVRDNERHVQRKAGGETVGVPVLCECKAQQRGSGEC